MRVHRATTGCRGGASEEEGRAFWRSCLSAGRRSNGQADHKQVNGKKGGHWTIVRCPQDLGPAFVGDHRQVMGEVISLSEHRRAVQAARNAGPVARTQRAMFFFDLSLPETYLAAERVERNFPGLRWQPASLESMRGGQPFSEPAEMARVIAEA